jgi:hypothetical protein
MKKLFVRIVFWLHLLLFFAASTSVFAEDLRTQLGNERVVLQVGLALQGCWEQSGRASQTDAGL